MNYYRFSPNDQSWNNWLLFTEHQENPPLRIKERYQHLVCPKCRQFDFDAAFKEGFDSDIKIRAKGDIVLTQDPKEGFYCVNEKLRSLIEQNIIKGASFKALGKTGWHAMKVTLRVKPKQQIYEACSLWGRKKCPVCKRAVSVTGLIEFENQIELPKRSGTCFTTPVLNQGQYRDLCVTEDVVHLLKKHQIKGGHFMKLLSPEDESQFRESTARGKPRWPANSRIAL